MHWLRSSLRWKWILPLVAFAAIVFFALPFLLPGGPRPGARGSRPVLQSKDVTIAESDPSKDVARESSELIPVSTNEATIEKESSETWTRFRGPLGQGISDEANIPIEWNDSMHMKWKTSLPGAGASSPILTDDFVFVTSYSGYGQSKNARGSTSNLKRQLNCIDRVTGKLLWTKTPETVLPEDPYQGMGVPEHGYATNTPVTDGQSVFAFFGKSGVYAYDLQGNEKWHVSVGTKSGNRGWGTGASLLLYKDLVIVNAAEESKAIYGIDKTTGKIVWTAPGGSLELCYSTPSLVRINDQRTDLVIAVLSEVWGLNPQTGKLVWFVSTKLTDNLAPSVIVDGTTVYVFGGYRSSGSMAIRVDEQSDDDVTKSHVIWTGRNSSYVATPVLYDKRLYWIDDRGQYFCIDASNGETVHKARVPGISSNGRPVYASPIVIEGKIYAQTRESGLFVLEPGDKLKVLAQNKFQSDDSICNATPAVSRGQLFLRSDSNLYCIMNDAKSID